MTGRLGDELLGGKMWETDLCANNHRYGSTLKYVKVLFRSQEVNVLKVLKVSL